jgi:hypothetical protein
MGRRGACALQLERIPVKMRAHGDAVREDRVAKVQ